MIFVIIPIAALIYFFGSVVHYYYWQNYFHEHDHCKRNGYYQSSGYYKSCNEDCSFQATLTSLIWPFWTILFLPIKCIYAIPKGTHRIGKSIGLKLTKIGSKNA